MKTIAAERHSAARSDSIMYYTTDPDFNITALVRADTGRVAERHEYDPYGFVTILNGDPGTAESPGDKGGTEVTEWAPNPVPWSDWENLILFAGYGMSAAPLVPNEQVGELIVAAPGCGDHSGYLPTAKAGGCSNNAIFLIAGPGVRPGRRCDGPVRLIDVAPTVAHLLGIPAPAHAEGRAVTDMLQE